MKPGDWICPSCNAMNFASRTSCYKCSGLTSSNFRSSNDDKVRMKPGDWKCVSCSAVNFASRTSCYKCYRSPNTRSEYQQPKSGDWVCHKCNAMNFASRLVCYKCGNDPKGLEEPISSGSSPHYSSHESSSQVVTPATRTTSDGLWVCNKCGECNAPPPNCELKLESKHSDDGDDHHNSHHDGYTASNYGRTDWSQSATLSGDDGSDDGEMQQWRRTGRYQ